MKYKRYSIFMLATLLIFAISACDSENEHTGLPSESESISESEVLLNNECDDAMSEPEGRGGELEPIKFTTGEFKGQYNPADIRGAHTITDIANYYDIPVSVLCEAFHIPVEKAENVQNKYYKYIFEGLAVNEKNIGNGSMVVFVSMYKGIPFDVHEPEYLLEPAVSILKSARQLTSDEIDYLEKYSVTIEEADPIPLEHLEIPEYYDDEFKIYGQTTFEDLIQMGITREQISAIIDAPLPDLSVRVKDYCVINGLPFNDDIIPEIYEILYSIEN